MPEDNNFYFICIFLIAMIVSVITIIFGVLYDSAVILLNGYSLFFIFGVLSLLLYSLNIKDVNYDDIINYIYSVLKHNGMAPDEKDVSPGDFNIKFKPFLVFIPAFTISISILPLSLMIVHLLNSARFNVKYDDKDNDELYWSNIAVFFLIMTIVFGGIIILNKLQKPSGFSDAPYIIGGNVGLLFLSGLCMFIINKMNIYVKVYSTSG